MPVGAMPLLISRGSVQMPRGGGLVPATYPGLAREYYGHAGTLQTVAGSAATNDGDPIGEWVNQVSGGTNLAQASGGSRPTLKTGANGLDSRPIVRFDGVDDFLSTTITAGAAKTLIAVLRKRSAPSGSNQNAIAIGANAQLQTNSATHATGWRYSTPTTALGGTAAAWQILVLRYTSLSLLEGWSGGAAFATLDPNNGYSTDTTLNLGSNSAGGVVMDVDFACYLQYTAVRTNAEINNLAGYLRVLYPSLTWSDI